MASNNRWRNYLKLVAKIGFSALFLFLVFRKIDFKDLWVQFLSVTWYWILAAVFFFIVSKVISSIRLNRYFKSIGLDFSEKENLKLYWLGMYYNMFLPGGIGGDGYKIWLLNKKFGTPAKKLFWAVFLDRVSGLSALGVLGVLFAIWIFPDPFIRYGLIGLLLVGVLAYYLIYRKFFSEFMDGFWITNWQGLLVQLSQLVCVLCIMFSLGIDHHRIEYLLLFLVSSVVAIFPFTIGGLGARELTFVYGSDLLKLDQQGSVVISFWFYVITLVVSLIGIWYVFRSPLPDPMNQRSPK
jgi:glycosyltransferase 2 family protein